jgi:hypothetical protein
MRQHRWFPASLFRVITPALVGATTFAMSRAFAQAAPELPQPSPKARVEQRVGLTDFAVDYSSPGVKGRKIWGGLVPFDELWRTGANAATTLKASRDFTFGGTAVPAGTYSVFTIPGKKTWTVILNTNTKVAATRGYEEKDDVARVSVTPTSAPLRERLAFLFANTTDDATRLDLEWEKLRVSVPITVDTTAQARANIDKALEDAWRPHFASARSPSRGTPRTPSPRPSRHRPWAKAIRCSKASSKTKWRRRSRSGRRRNPDPAILFWVSHSGERHLRGVPVGRRPRFLRGALRGRDRSAARRAACRPAARCARR